MRLLCYVAVKHRKSNETNQSKTSIIYLRVLKMKHSKRLEAFVFLLVLFLQGWSSCIHAQNPDSLERVLQTGKFKPSDQLQLCHKLSYAYAYVDFHKSISYASQGIELAKKEGDWVMAGFFFQDMGVAHFMVSQLDSAAFYLDIALEYAAGTKNKLLEASINAVLGNLYYRKGAYADAMQHYIIALPVLEAGKKQEQLGALYGNIADLYQALHHFDKAFEYYHKAMVVAQELNDKNTLGSALIGLSAVYLSKSNYDEALACAEKSLGLLILFNDNVNLVFALNAIAQCHFKGFKNYDKAGEYAQKALQISETSGFPVSKAISLHLLSDIAFDKGAYKTSEDDAFRALAADSTDINLNSLLISNIALANINMGNREKASRYFKKYTDLISIRTNKEIQGAFLEMQARYETEKQGVRIVALEEGKRFSDWLAVVGGILLLVILSAILLRHRIIQQKKRSAGQELFRQVQQQKLAAIRDVLEGKVFGQNRLAKTLYKGIGGKLSVVKANLLRLTNDNITEAEAKTEFTNAVDLIDDVIKELSWTAIYTMPPSLEKNGLKDSLTDFCGTVPNTQFRFFGDDVRRDALLELTIYRTVYELVTGTMQRGGAAQINVKLVLDGELVSLTVWEKGLSFDPENLKNETIDPIRSRIGMLHGTCIVSMGDDDFEIDITFDLEEIIRQ